jgi:ribosomal protein S18 acetylase RimI-like enzyme
MEDEDPFRELIGMFSVPSDGDYDNIYELPELDWPENTTKIARKSSRPGTLLNGITQKSALTSSDIIAIADLIAVCNAHDGLRMRIKPVNLRKRPEGAVNDFMYYEDGRLIGYLSGDSYGTKEKELTGMVHPDYRRRGIFSALFEAARETYRQAGAERLVLICERSSTSGRAWVATTGAVHDFSEHEMVLGTYHERGKKMEGLEVRLATEEDTEPIVAILATDTGNETDVRAWVSYLLAHPEESNFFLATLRGKPLGTIRLDDRGDEMGIYGFEVRMGYRGLGYGRQIMEQVIRYSQARFPKPIMLDVDTTNTNAIGLYRSVGFEIRTTYDYYGYTLSQTPSPMSF